VSEWASPGRARRSDVLDVAGVGVGPFNLGLCALAADADGLAVEAYDDRESFSWHPGVMFDWATLQVSFLADLVTLVHPTSRWSFLSYLAERDRMYPFYVAERFHVPRREYADYCAWVAASLPSVVLGTRVERIDWDSEAQLWVLTLCDVATGAVRHRRARNVVLGVGTRPRLPAALQGVAGPRVVHSAEHLHAVERLVADGVTSVTVVGSGQSGAEVFLDLLGRQRDAGWSLTWLTRTASFAPLDYSKLVLEQTTPAYVRYFHGLPEPTRDRLLAGQWQFYKGIDTETIDLIHAALYDHLLDGDRPPVRLMAGVRLDGADHCEAGVRLRATHQDTGAAVTVETEAVVAATGYAAEPPSCLAPVEHLLHRDGQGRHRIGLDHRVATAPEVTGGLYVQNADLHTHGAAAPDLGFGAYRNAVILNAVSGRDLFRLPRRTAFQTFAPTPPSTTARPIGAVSRRGKDLS
jgi:lysine N6-hydroxylase